MHMLSNYELINRFFGERVLTLFTISLSEEKILAKN